MPQQFDFGSLKRPTGAAKPTDPIEIFNRLPSLPNTPNDLWSGQAEALREWNSNRKNTDILISLNTGAGKTLVGLILAQSLVNEGVERVIFACSTIDLVIQTKKEAEKLGISHTVRVKGSFDNDLFETGAGFCITTYAGVFNSRSLFLGKHFPGAIVFDDAHVAEKLIRNSFTLSVSKKKHQAIYNAIGQVFTSTFRDLARSETYLEIIGGQSSQIILVPPSAVFENSELITNILRDKKLGEDRDAQFPYRYLIDHISKCALIISSSGLEFTPPFLPISILPYFSDKNIRRIYLSATINYNSEFARAFGRIPDKIIAPKVDAGNGERLVLLSKYFEGSEVSNILVSTILRKHKIVIAVSSYRMAKQWEEFGDPPTREQFSTELEVFRKSEKGSFVLVSRVDGIDLPDETCRVMVMDDLPIGESLLERYQWQFLNMQNFHASRMANKIIQLFGRINRGRNDYGVFLVNKRELNIWLQKERNLALLPELLRKQILLSKSLQEQKETKTPGAIRELVDLVIGRDKGWLDYYSASIDGMEIDLSVHKRTESVERVLAQSAVAEVNFMSCLWNNNYRAGRRELEELVEDVAAADTKLGGWYSLWIGFCYDVEKDREAATIEYSRARIRLSERIYLPTYSFEGEGQDIGEPSSPFAHRHRELLLAPSERAFSSAVERMERDVSSLDIDNATSLQLEEAVRCLGEYLGFEATRPDNDNDGGPDALWRDKSGKTTICVGLELKTDKKDGTTYNKKEIGQAHDNLAWIKSEYPEDDFLGLVIIGPEVRCSGSANPTDEMHWGSVEHLRAIKNRFIASLRDCRKLTPMERLAQMEQVYLSAKLSITELFSEIASKKLSDLQ